MGQGWGVEGDREGGDRDGVYSPSYLVFGVDLVALLLVLVDLPASVRLARVVQLRVAQHEEVRIPDLPMRTDDR